MVLEEKRKQWKTLYKKNELFSISELRNTKPALYFWLYRNDHSWLSSIVYAKTSPAKAQECVDWKKRDQNYLKILRTTFNGLVLKGEKRRFSRSFLISCIRQSGYIEKHFHKLPRLVKFLDSVTETLEQHRLRRLHLAYQQLVEEDKGVSRWRLLRMANVRKEYCTPVVEEEIQELLNGCFHQEFGEKRKVAC